MIVTRYIVGIVGAILEWFSLRIAPPSLLLTLGVMMMKRSKVMKHLDLNCNDLAFYADVDMQQVSSEEYLVTFLNSFMALLVVVPGHPEQGPFYLVKGLLKVVSDFPW